MGKELSSDYESYNDTLKKSKSNPLRHGDYLTPSPRKATNPLGEEIVTYGTAEGTERRKSKCYKYNKLI